MTISQKLQSVQNNVGELFLYDSALYPGNNRNYEKILQSLQGNCIHVIERKQTGIFQNEINEN